MSQNSSNNLEEKFEEAINYVFEILSSLKIKIITSAFTGRSLTLVKRDGSYTGKIFGAINYDSLTTTSDSSGVELLFPESVLSQLASLGIEPSQLHRMETDERYMLILPRESYKNKELLVELVRLAYELN